MPLHDRPRHRPYARIERERRFVLDRLPDAVDPRAFERLRDRYIVGTHLRLRRVEAPDGRLVTAKLGQKIASAAADPRERRMTTIYLPEEEAAVFSTLPARVTVKRRYALAEQGRTFCVDVWEAPAAVAGTILAEVEAETLAELEAITMPAWARAEVTGDDAYSAISLARG